jgi:hypothetical protein
VVTNVNGLVYIKNVVQIVLNTNQLCYHSNGEGEKVLGQVMMLKGLKPKTSY